MCHVSHHSRKSQNRRWVDASHDKFKILACKRLPEHLGTQTTVLSSPGRSFPFALLGTQTFKMRMSMPRMAPPNRRPASEKEGFPTQGVLVHLHIELCNLEGHHAVKGEREERQGEGNHSIQSTSMRLDRLELRAPGVPDQSNN